MFIEVHTTVPQKNRDKKEWEQRLESKLEIVNSKTFVVAFHHGYTECVGTELKILILECNWI